MKRTINFIGNILGTFCALLFFAEIFYHTTNDYFFICTKFRDLSLYGWGMMLLLWSGALFLWQKKKVSFLPFVAWMSVICIVLEFYRFLIYSDNENCRFYIRIVFGMEIATLLLAIYKRCSVAAVYSIAAFIITVLGHFAVVPSLCYLSDKILFIFLSLGTVLWLAIKLCQSHHRQKIKQLLQSFSWLIVGGILLSVAVMWYQHMVFGIRFYERPVTKAVENPKVSVVIPVYNAEDVIERLLDSLRKQTLKDIEIIAVDDGSTDKTPAILDKYAAFDKRIKVIHQKNAYVGAARNRGMAEAKGEYIGFVDNDDWVSLDYYEELYKEAKKHDADVVYTRQVWTVTRKFPEVKNILNDGNYDKHLQYLETIGLGYIWNKIYKLDLLKENHILFTTRRTMYEDGYFSMQVLMYANKISSVKNVAYFFSKYTYSESVKKHYPVDYMLPAMYLDLDRLIKNTDFDEEKKQQQRYLKLAQNQRDVCFENLYSVLVSDEDKSIFRQLVKEKFPDDEIDFDKLDEDNAVSKAKVKVSVIMPVYNGEKSVRRTLDSLLKQTFKEMEIIAVDDGSTDSTPKILDDYAAAYENIKVIHQKNAYVGAARNVGRKLARGYYIAFIDADDTVAVDFYEKLYQTAIDSHADIVAAENVFFVWENKDNLKEPYAERAAFTKNEEIEDLASYRQKVDGYVWDKLYRKSFLDKHNIWCTTRRTPAEDNFLTTPALMFADKMYVAKGATFYYHRGSPSETGVKHTKLNDEIVEMFADLDEFIHNSGLDEAKTDTWLKATKVARQRIVGNYYDCLIDEDKAVVKEKILKAFPEDVAIFENPVQGNEPHHQLYQQI